MSISSHPSHWLPCSVVFISTAHEQQYDIMTATAMFVSEKEPLIAVSLSKSHRTLELIKISGFFTVVIASISQKDLVPQLGSARGDEVDKFGHFSIKTLTPVPGRPRVPADAAAWLHCNVDSHHSIGEEHLVLGRVVDHKNLGNPALVWYQNELFGLKPLQ